MLSSIFSSTATLHEKMPADKVLQYHINLVLSWPPSRKWKRPPGQPHYSWIDWNDINTTPPADVRCIIHGHWEVMPQPRWLRPNNDNVCYLLEQRQRPQHTLQKPAPEISTINSTSDSGASFSCRLYLAWKNWQFSSSSSYYYKKLRLICYVVVARHHRAVNCRYNEVHILQVLYTARHFAILRVGYSGYTLPTRTHGGAKIAYCCRRGSLVKIRDW